MSERDLRQVPDTMLLGVPIYLDVSDVKPEARESYVVTCAKMLTSYREEYDRRGRENSELSVKVLA